MFIADSVLLFPFKSILSIFQEIYIAALQEMASEADTIRAELGQLYLALEAGSLTEEAFDARETELLDRLDEIEQRGELEGEADGEDHEGDDDEETEEEVDDDDRGSDPDE